jgi:sodium/potassium-transporting ATPase subunit alpha
MARRMFEHNVLVKMLPTVETLGSIDTIASDKTGTLTQNKMSVLHIVSAMRTVEMEECRRLYDNGDHSIREVVRISALCNRAIYDQSTIDFPPIQRKVIGDASDTGILLFAEEFCKATQVRESYEKLLEIPFNSKNKWMLNIWNIDNQPVLLMKGAAEIIMNKCTTMLMEDGTEIALNDEMRQRLSQIQEELAANGERVLGLARQDLVNFTVNSHFDADTMNFPIEGHCFVGLVALIDPPRVDVLEAVQKCQKASIRVMMVTGDHPATATAISRMVGIVTKDKVVQVTGNDTLADTDTLEEIKSRALAITGHVIPDFDQTTWDNIFKHDEIVWARTTPDHKLTIVMECQRRKHVVAVTGDGVNDAPALKQANVGVAMGAGSEVAREAADIVLTDSKFSSIVVGIENGRMAFDNMKKVILYLIPAGTFAELLPILAYVFFGVPQMLSSFLMICVCVGTDIFPSLAMIYVRISIWLLTYCRNLPKLI